MKNQYAGDVGDLSKFALLKSLRKTFPEERIGVLWYLTPDDPIDHGPKDGRFTEYEWLRDCDPDLYLALHEIASKRPRKVSEFGRHHLTEGLTEFDELLDTSGLAPPLRSETRRAWFERALAKVAGCPFVLLDPDNGLATDEVKESQSRASKFVLREELKELHDQGRTVICYQHAVRSEPFDSLLRKILKTYPGSFALRWHAIQARAYVVWPAVGRERETVLWGEGLVGGPWRTHFTMVSVSPRVC